VGEEFRKPLKFGKCLLFRFEISTERTMRISVNQLNKPTIASK